MERILVEVEIPAMSARYDFDLPAQCLVREVKAGMVSLLGSVSGAAYFDPALVALYDRGTGRQLGENTPLSDAGVTDGSSLMLV